MSGNSHQRTKAETIKELIELGRQAKEYIAARATAEAQRNGAALLGTYPVQFGDNKNYNFATVAGGAIASHMLGGRAIPSYDTLWEQVDAEFKREIKSISSTIATYKDVIKTWTAAKYAPVVKQTTIIVHKEAFWKNRPATTDRGLGGVVVGDCQKWAMHQPTGHVRTTNKDGDVTCQRCLKGMK